MTTPRSVSAPQYVRVLNVNDRSTWQDATLIDPHWTDHESGEVWAIIEVPGRPGDRFMVETDRVVACERCAVTYGPTHMGSKGCRSGSLAAGGHRSHCSCDTCF